MTFSINDDDDATHIFIIILSAVRVNVMALFQFNFVKPILGYHGGTREAISLLSYASDVKMYIYVQT